ncbi:MAG: bifunctional folylpolyglutamate synthase/dihydrofolate synthase, partial [Peptococcaceae bacterium]|nr:bifunctional folylpolyglutamate synthase/dihydrofolate synthase [Peptococcaceae bacterium]
MDYQSCLNYMSTHCARNIPGGFERTERMAELLGNPQEKLRIIHIAGTNGKGSTASVISSILQQAGYRVGLFTSPHLERYEERIQINRELISEDDFAEVLTRIIEKVIPQLLAEGMQHPGEFEILTAAAMFYFADKTDFAVFEVGLGGTLDPTNIIKAPLLTIITPVSLDHCQILGDTVEAIAREKAGILKQGVPLIAAPQQPEALQAIIDMAGRLQVPVKAVRMENLIPIKTSMQGAYQQMNCNTALEAVKNLQERRLIQITGEQIADGLQNAFWPGRMEYIELEDNRSILLDGAHNPAGISSLAENLRSLYADKKLILFLSILDDKEQVSML